MNTELKKNFVLSLILHVAVLACICLITAFAPQPRPDTTIMMSIGGPGEGGGGGEEAPPPPPEPQSKVETPQPKQEETPPKVVEPARVVPKQEDIVIPKPKTTKPVEKPKVEEKEPPKKEEVKKEITKPKVVASTKLVKRTDLTKESKSKTPAKPDPSLSAAAIRGRLGKAVNSVKVGTPGSGSGMGTGAGGSQFGEYYSMLSRILYEAWDTPGTATPSMSTVVQVRISNDGTLSFVKVVRKSGSDIMDESVIGAVLKTKKVPQPPAGLPSEVTITFQPEGA